MENLLLVRGLVCACLPWQALQMLHLPAIVPRMRFSVILLSAAILAACETTPPSASAPAAVVATTPAAVVAPTTSRGARLLAQAGQANAPTRAETERLFGAADIIRQDGAGAALTYRLSTCALLLVFQADGGNVLRLADAHASARQPSLASPSLEQCASEAEARRR